MNCNVHLRDLAESVKRGVLQAGGFPLELPVQVAPLGHARGADRAGVSQHHYVRPLERPDASAISSAKAQRLLGWTPRRSWRDYLDEQGRRRA